MIDEAIPASDVVADGRLVFTSPRAPQGVLDGGWWPRSRDLSQELPGLLAAVASRFGVVVVRVSLSATVWDATPEQVAVGDRVVQVAWFRVRDARTIRLLGDHFWHLDLLVIPAGTAADAAGRALALAASGDIVAAVAPSPPLPQGNPAAGDQWSSPGSTAVVDLRCGTVRSPLRTL